MFFRCSAKQAISMMSTQLIIILHGALHATRALVIALAQLKWNALLYASIRNAALFYDVYE